MSYLSDYTKSVSYALVNTAATYKNGREIEIDKAFALFSETIKLCSDQGGLIFFCGNGASATMAEHFSHDCFQNADLRTFTVSETSHLTAISNDIGYEDVFSYRIGKMCSSKDVLVTISSSGNSANIIKAIKTAVDKNMFVVTISGKAGDNLSRRLGDLNFHVHLDTYGLVESAHAVLLHSWFDFYLDLYKGGRH